MSLRGYPSPPASPAVASPSRSRIPVRPGSTSGPAPIVPLGHGRTLPRPRIDNKPIDSKPIVNKPVVNKPVVNKPAVHKPVVHKPIDNKPTLAAPDSNLQHLQLAVQKMESLRCQQRADTIAFTTELQQLVTDLLGGGGDGPRTKETALAAAVMLDGWFSLNESFSLEMAEQLGRMEQQVEEAKTGMGMPHAHARRI